MEKKSPELVEIPYVKTWEWIVSALFGLPVLTVIWYGIAFLFRSLNPKEGSPPEARAILWAAAAFWIAAFCAVFFVCILCPLYLRRRRIRITPESVRLMQGSREIRRMNVKEITAYGTVCYLRSACPYFCTASREEILRFGEMHWKQAARFEQKKNFAAYRASEEGRWLLALHVYLRRCPKEERSKVWIAHVFQWRPEIDELTGLLGQAPCDTGADGYIGRVLRGEEGKESHPASP